MTKKAKLIADIRQPNLTAEQRTFLRKHELMHEAYAVARKINRSAYVKRQMYVADLLLQRKN